MLSLRHCLCVAAVVSALALAAARTITSPEFGIKPLPVPGARGLVTFDYFAYDRDGRLWVPAGNTGSVDVIDAKTDNITAITGFPVQQVELRGKLQPMGPSSVSVGDGVVYIGSRADSTICVIDERTLKRDGCIAFAPASAGLAAAPDALIYVSATRELWGTSGVPAFGVPAADRAIKIFSAAQPHRLTPAGKIGLPASAEGYAVDNSRGLLYTNLEETGQTAAIDVRKHAVVSTWQSCSDPSGVAVDSKRGFVFVACSDHVIVLDTNHQGRIVGSIPAGAGIDNIDYSEDGQLLYVAAADAGTLTIGRVDDKGSPSLLAVVPTKKGARSVVAGPNGSAYVIDPFGGRILKVYPR